MKSYSEKIKSNWFMGGRPLTWYSAMGGRLLKPSWSTGWDQLPVIRCLSRMHRSDEEFYKDLLKAKIQYMKTRQYWADNKKVG